MTDISLVYRTFALYSAKRIAPARASRSILQPKFAVATTFLKRIKSGNFGMKRMNNNTNTRAQVHLLDPGSDSRRVKCHHLQRAPARRKKCCVGFARF